MVLDENILNQIKTFIGQQSLNFNVLEDQIDIEQQMEYFEFVKDLKGTVTTDEIPELKEQLLDENTHFEKKKEILAKLASIVNVEAYRIIEAYAQKPDEFLRNWSILAMQESRMQLESSFLDQNQIFISTGLGGKGTKLRYFIVFIARSQTEFQQIQKDRMQKEFEFFLSKSDCEIEKIDFVENFCTLLALIPIHTSIKSVFNEAIAECNQYGNFLTPNPIVTNIKVLSTEEIKKFLEEHKKNDNETK